MIKKLMSALPDTPERTLLWFSVHHDCGYCPSGCRRGSFPTGRVYRSSRRSLTMQCTACRLQWMVTVHRVAQVVARKAETERRPERRHIAQLWTAWASGIDERRGRRAGPLTDKPRRATDSRSTQNQHAR